MQKLILVNPDIALLAAIVKALDEFSGEYSIEVETVLENGVIEFRVGK